MSETACCPVCLAIVEVRGGKCVYCGHVFTMEICQTCTDIKRNCVGCELVDDILREEKNNDKKNYTG